MSSSIFIVFWENKNTKIRLIVASGPALTIISVFFVHNLNRQSFEPYYLEFLYWDPASIAI